MAPLQRAALTVLLLCSSTPRVLAAECVNAKCPDANAIARARSIIQETCGCTREGQSPGAYKKCVKGALKLANLTALIPDKRCRKLIRQCENASICGKPNAAVCCVLKSNGRIKASIVGSAAKCTKGSACGALLGRFSTSDACADDGTCAGPETTSTTVPQTTTSTLPPTTTSTTPPTTSTTAPPTTTTTTTPPTTTTTEPPTSTTGPPTTTITTTTTTTTLPSCGGSFPTCDGECPTGLECAFGADGCFCRPI